MAAAAPQLRWVRCAPQGIRVDEEQPRLGVLGGTFNPITRAHLALAELALREFHLHEVLFVVPERLPHRAPEEASLEQRLALLDAALEPCEQFSLAVCSQGLFLEMAEALAPHYPAVVKVYFLVGSDAAERILRWKYDEPGKALTEMFARFELVVASRAGAFSIPDDPPLRAFRNRIHTLALPASYQQISATAVRERVRQGNPIDDLVPAVVAEAIRRTGLYRS